MGIVIQMMLGVALGNELTRKIRRIKKDFRRKILHQVRMKNDELAIVVDGTVE